MTENSTRTGCDNGEMHLPGDFLRRPGGALIDSAASPGPGLPPTLPSAILGPAPVPPLPAPGVTSRRPDKQQDGKRLRVAVSDSNLSSEPPASRRPDSYHTSSPKPVTSEDGRITAVGLARVQQTDIKEGSCVGPNSHVLTEIRARFGCEYAHAHAHRRACVLSCDRGAFPTVSDGRIV